MIWVLRFWSCQKGTHQSHYIYCLIRLQKRHKFVNFLTVCSVVCTVIVWCFFLTVVNSKHPAVKLLQLTVNTPPWLGVTAGVSLGWLGRANRLGGRTVAGQPSSSPTAHSMSPKTLLQWQSGYGWCVTQTGAVEDQKRGVVCLLAKHTRQFRNCWKQTLPEPLCEYSLIYSASSAIH